MCKKKNIKEIENNILSLVQLDYESINTIRKELSESVGYEPDDNEIEKALKALENERRINFYLYNKSTNKFDIQKGLVEPINEIWFMATQLGR